MVPTAHGTKGEGATAEERNIAKKSAPDPNTTEGEIFYKPFEKKGAKAA